MFSFQGIIMQLESLESLQIFTANRFTFQALKVCFKQLKASSVHTVVNLAKTGPLELQNYIFKVHMTIKSISCSMELTKNSSR